MNDKNENFRMKYGSHRPTRKTIGYDSDGNYYNDWDDEDLQDEVGDIEDSPDEDIVTKIENYFDDNGK